MRVRHTRKCLLMLHVRWVPAVEGADIIACVHVRGFVCSRHLLRRQRMLQRVLWVTAVECAKILIHGWAWVWDYGSVLPLLQCLWWDVGVICRVDLCPVLSFSKTVRGFVWNSVCQLGLVSEWIWCIGYAASGCCVRGSRCRPLRISVHDTTHR